jgi:hypothetical protein
MSLAASAAPGCGANALGKEKRVSTSRTSRRSFLARKSLGTSDRIRIIKHEPVPKSGCFEVRFPDGTPPKFFYWEDEPSRRLRPDQLDSKQALNEAKAFARSSSVRRG